MTSYRLRSLIPKSTKNVLRELSYVSIFSDVGSLISYYRVNHPNSSRPTLTATVNLKIRRLGNRPITIRTRGTDARVVFDTFVHQFHLPPQNAVSKSASLILDLGSNIGCTMAHLACVYPDASIVGVELDSSNVSLCRKNVLPWSDRCQIVEGAVWPEDGQVQYEYQEGSEDAFTAVISSRGGEGERRTAKAISINTLLSRICGPGRRIDYMKMDIEGAECDVLRLNTAWAARVNCIKVELHGDYTKQRCMMDLDALGFNASADTSHAICVVGVRDS